MPTPSEQSNLRDALVRILRARGVPHADTAVQVIAVRQAHPVLFTVKAEERAGLAVAQALARILVKMFSSRPACQPRAAERRKSAAYLPGPTDASGHKEGPLS